tara:strand:- start:10750 stop:12258 length:1509 start_codon:yes stop_codon:yes gene_type:complete
MDIQNMHIAIRQGVDKINSLQADSLLSEEIDIELNKNMRRFINLKYGKNNIHRKGFEESQKRIDDLSTLIDEYRGFTKFSDREMLSHYKTVSKAQYLYREIFELPYNYMHHIESSCNALRASRSTRVSYRLEFYNDVDYQTNEDFEENSKYIVIPWSKLTSFNGEYVSGAIKLVAGLELSEDADLAVIQGAGSNDDWGSGGPSMETTIWEATNSNMLLNLDSNGAIINLDNSYKEYIINHILTNHIDDVIIKWEKSNNVFFKDSFIVTLKPDSDLYTWARTQGEAQQIVNTLETVAATAGYSEDGIYVASNAVYTEPEDFTTKLKVCGLYIDELYEQVYDDINIEEIDTTDIVGFKRKFTSSQNTVSKTDDTSDYWTFVKNIGKNFEGANLPITYIQHDDLHGLLKDPFNRPGTNSMFGVFTHKAIELYTLSESSTSAYLVPDSVKIKYLRTPLPMSFRNNIGCELPQHTHEEIVAMTVSSILEGFSDPRYRTQTAELNKQE